MRINADFCERVVVRPDDRRWVPSPAAGVDRVMLDRIGDEVARATSLVRFAPGSAFAEHTHGGGEEFLVLEGVFSDETGNFPAGSYVRNPVGTAHSPHTGPGCTIFVKLHQFDPEDRATVAIDTDAAEFTPGAVEGLSVMTLHRWKTEEVRLLRFEPGTRAPAHDHPQGEEILVLEGSFSDEEGTYGADTWIRNPPGSRHRPGSETGCLLYMKTGHLPPAD